MRHGALLASAEITLALAKIPRSLPDALSKELRNTIMRIEKARLYRGKPHTIPPPHTARTLANRKRTLVAGKRAVMRKGRSR